MIQVRQRGNAVVLALGERRGLMFYVSATHDVRDTESTAEVDVFCRPLEEFEARYPLTPGTPIRELLAQYRGSGMPIQSAAAVQIAYLEGIAKKRATNWSGDALGNNERRNQPKLVRGRKPKKISKSCALLACRDVNYDLGQAADNGTAAQHKTQEPLMTAKKTSAKIAKPVKSEKPVETKPSKIGDKISQKAPAAEPKVEKTTKAKAEKPVADTETTEGAVRGRKRDGELYDSKVQSTEKVAKEGSFYADVQAASKKPVKLSALIAKMEELHPTTPEMKHHQRAAAMTVDSLKRMGYIALVEA